MPKANTTVKAVRVDNDKLEALEKMLNGRTINSWLNEKIEEAVSFPVSENKKRIPEVNPFDLPEDALRDIESMSSLSGTTLRGAIEEFDRLLNDGTLIIGKTITVGLPRWVDRFISACEDKCLDVERVGENAVKSIERGTL